MSGCPSINELRQLLTDPRAAEGANSVELHLATCATCRERLETLAGVEVVIPANAGSRRGPRSDSSALRGAIESLRAMPEANADVARGRGLAIDSLFISCAAGTCGESRQAWRV